jgi:hypothetical protein
MRTLKERVPKPYTHFALYSEVVPKSASFLFAQIQATIYLSPEMRLEASSWNRLGNHLGS